MKIIKRPAVSIEKEQAHGGSGSRKVFATSEYTKGNNLDAITHGFLPGGAKFDWHSHADIDEVMIVLAGSGIVSDRDGDYSYDPGDVFIFPANIEHKIFNPSEAEHEMIFVRMHV